MGRLALVVCVVSVVVFLLWSVALAQQELKPGEERFRDASERAIAYLSLILSLLLVLFGPAIVVWIICRAMRLEGVGALRALYCAIVIFIAALALFYRLKPLTDALVDWTQFYKVTDLGVRAGAVVIVCLLVFKYFIRVSVTRSAVFTFFYVVSFYIAARLSYSFLQRTAGIEFLKVTQY